MRPLRVAVIDSGINPGHPHIGSVSGGVRLNAEQPADTDFIDRLGHGTAVAAAIHERAPRAELFAVRVFERELSASIHLLVGGIDWAAARQVDLINLSLGTVNPDHAGVLRGAIERAISAGALVVSAGRHQGQTFLPGTLDGVLGGELDWECPRLAVRVSDVGGTTVCRASGYPRPVPGLPRERNLKGLSFAVANVTGVLARELRPAARPTVDMALTLLRESEGIATLWERGADSH